MCVSLSPKNTIATPLKNRLMQLGLKDQTTQNTTLIAKGKYYFFKHTTSYYYLSGKLGENIRMFLHGGVEF